MPIRRSLLSLCVLAASVVGTAVGTQAADWGDLSITFKLDGKAPTPKPSVVNKDEAVCGKHKLVDETLLVNSANSGIANVIMWLTPDRGTKVAAHPDYEAAAKSEVPFDNKDCRFEPHIVVLRTTQTLLVGNKDSIGHNTNVATLSNPPQNVLIPASGTLKQKYTVEERLPVSVSCNIHPWMKSYAVIKETPYVGVSDENGKIVIKNLPAGKWTFTVWHEGSGYVSEVTRGGKTEKWSRGKLENVTIKAGANDLGEAKVALKVFKL